MFGFFSRKSAPTPAAAIEKETKNVSTTSVIEAGSSANTGTIAPHFQFPAKQQQQHTPSPSIDDTTAALAIEQPVSKPKPKPKPRAKPKPKPKPKEVSPALSELPPPGPVDTPSPSPEEVIVTDPTALHALISSVPAQTLHSYTLTRLNPKSDPLSSITLTPPVLTALTAFFSTLAPPPKLHCVRCHRGYFDLENSDTACHVAHDDDSAIVERVGLGKGSGTEYETLWQCCSRTVEGDGDMGPPDGWCYEGAHTTDTKRARFRADSTPQDDKLVSCSRLRCNMPSPLPRSSLGRASRKRTRKTMEEDSDEDEDEDARSISSSHTRSHSRNISMISVKGKLKETLAEDTPTETKTRPTKRPRSRKQSTSMLPPASKDKDDGEAMDVDAPQQPSPPKSPRRKNIANSKPISSSSQPTQRSPLSTSYVPGNATAPHTRSESPTRKPRNRVEVELLSRSPGSKGSLSAKSSLKDLKTKGSSSSIRVTKTTTKPRALTEVVDTSVDGETAWC